MEMSREADLSSAHLNHFEAAEPAGCLSLTSPKLKKDTHTHMSWRTSGEMISAALGCSGLRTDAGIPGEEPRQEAVGECVKAGAHGRSELEPPKKY